MDEATIEDLAFGVRLSREVDEVDLQVPLTEVADAVATNSNRC